MPIINGFICTNENLNSIRPNILSKAFRKLILKNNQENEFQLPLIPLKNLRHTYATAALANDVNLKVVSEILGHSKTSTTQNFYEGSVTKTLQQEAIIKMENLFLRKGLENVKKA